MVAPWITAAETAFPESPYAQTAVEYATFVLYKLTAEKYPGVIFAGTPAVHQDIAPKFDRHLFISGSDLLFLGL